MYIKEIFAVYILCAILCMVNSLPMNMVITKTGIVYKLVPVGTLNNLKGTQRSAFSDNLNDEDERTNKESETSHKTILEASRKGEEGVLRMEKREALKPAAYTNYPVVYRVRREYQEKRRYGDSDNDYDDKDYAGDDRKGSAVGYMDDDDDFPTVVW